MRVPEGTARKESRGPWYRAARLQRLTAKIARASCTNLAAESDCAPGFEGAGVRTPSPPAPGTPVKRPG